MRQPTLVTLAFAFSVNAASLVGIPVPAAAHFREPTPIGWAEWAERQYAIGGNRCCDKSDAWVFTGAWRYEFETGGTAIVGITLTFESGLEVFMPRSRFLDRTRNPDDVNPTGGPVEWFRVIENPWCFDPSGPLT